MKHQNIDQLGVIAEIVQFKPQEKLTRRQRLERWADMLDRHPGKLNALIRIEHMKPTERPQARVDNSPLEIAFKDPMLREDEATALAMRWCSSGCQIDRHTGSSVIAITPAA